MSQKVDDGTDRNGIAVKSSASFKARAYRSLSVSGGFEILRRSSRPRRFSLRLENVRGTTILSSPCSIRSIRCCSRITFVVPRNARQSAARRLDREKPFVTICANCFKLIRVRACIIPFDAPSEYFTHISRER